jgi:transcriptional regulator with GAF, ATPase, and Fis domain
MQALLTIESGQGEPRVCNLEPGRPVTLGRHRKNVIVLHDEHASRWHAEVFFADGQWFVKDSGTLNGTRLDGIPIQQPVALEHGQVIGIGRTFLRFTSESAAKRAATEPGLSNPSDSATSSSLVEPDQTVLHSDELNVLCYFMAESVKEIDPRALIQKALETIHGQVGASVTGFLSLDKELPVPKIVLPAQARLDIPLSRHLTQAVQRQGKSVWLGIQPEMAQESESLMSYADALCLPLLAGDRPLGALHAYRTGRVFSEREVRFCEVLAGHLTNSLHVLRIQRTLAAENSRLRSQSLEADALIGKSPAMQNLRQLIGKLAPGRSPVLIVGESGVGKELVALSLHGQSPRRDEPLVSINCAAIAPSLLESELFGHCRGAFSSAERDHRGLFQQADEGTLFLDEVGELSPELQAKLLRVIEGKGFRPVGAEAEVQVDVRIIAATHRDLEQEVKNNRFRADLYFRLEGLQIRVPPLRDHLQDIPELADYFLERLAVTWGRQAQLSSQAVRCLEAYSWPGNVRQLRSVLENAVALTDNDVIEPANLRLPAGTCVDEPVSLNLEELEAWAIRQALRRTEGNLAQAARLLGIVRETLSSKLKKYSIDKSGGTVK